MRIQFTFTAAALAAGLVLPGCAATVYEGKYDWSDGWRSAEVVEIASASEMERPRFYDCVRRASPEQLATTKFAVVVQIHVSLTETSGAACRRTDRSGG